ncbi:hypothetical protein [Gloeothece citriformis]|nr:hypothetical protein [Gloeothece citriformis]
MINTFSFNWIDNLFSFSNLTETSTKELTDSPTKGDVNHNQNTIKPNHAPLKSKTRVEPLTVGVFFHHRDVNVVLDDLKQAGFPLNTLTLMARNSERYHWRSGLTIFSHFEQEIFSFSQECEQFFQGFFRRGKYILVVQGTEEMRNFASQVLSRRRNHSKVWNVVQNH